MLDPIPLQPANLMQQLAQANKFDLEALPDNHQGRLSSRQLATLGKIFGLMLLITVILLALALLAFAGFGMLSSHEYLKAVAPCGSAILLVVVFGWLFGVFKGLGGERFFVNKLSALLQLLLMPIDLLRQRVSSVQDMTRREMDTENYRVKDSTNNSHTEKRYFYYYTAGSARFNVSSEGYQAFPAEAQRCTLYYLPLSKHLINIEVNL